MSRLARVISLFSMAVLGFTIAVAGDLDADVEAIKRTALMKNEGVVKLDPQIYAGAFAEDAVVLPPGRAGIEGRAAILEWARGWSSTAKAKIEIDTTIDEVQVMGDWAYVRMTIARTILFPDRDPTNDVVKTIQVHQRQADGSWKIARDIWNAHPSE